MKPIRHLFIFSFCLIMSSAFAQKFGHMNSMKILEVHPDIQAAKKQLETLKVEFETQLEGKVKSLQGKYVELQAREADLAPRDFQAQAIKLQEEESALMKSEQDMQKQFAARQKELYDPVLEKINSALSAYCKAEGYTFIFDVAQGFLLYADESSDVTEQLMAKMGL